MGALAVLGGCILVALGLVLVLLGSHRRLKREMALRKDSEARLLQAKDLLERTSRVAKVGGWSMDLASNTQVWTEEGNRIREIPPGTVLSYEQALAFYDSDTAARLSALRELAIRNGSSWSHESLMTTASGRKIWVQGRGEAVVVDGKTVSLVGTIQDISDRKQAENALTRTTHLLQAIIDHSPLRIFWKDKDLRYLGCNRVFAEDAGLNDTSAIVGMDDYRMPWREQAERYRADDRSVIASGCPRLFYEEPQTFPDGRSLWLSTSKVPLLGENNEIIGVLGFYEDITDRKALLQKFQRRTAELEMHNEILHQINRGAPLAEMLVAMTQQIEALHPEMLCSILLLDDDGRHLRLAAAPSLPDYFRRASDGLPVADGVGSCGAAAFRKERVVAEDLLVHPNWVSARELVAQAGLASCWSQPIIDPHGVVFGTFAIYHRQPATPDEDELALIETYASLAELVIERHRAEDRIRSLAFYDTLTHLPNRRMLEDRMNLAMASSKRSGRHGAVMFLDLDNFKPLNDRYGHALGDLLLVEAARRLTDCVRETDTVARFGGDEFVVMLAELDIDRGLSVGQAAQVAEKIRAALAEPYHLALRQEGAPDLQVEHCCTASIGIALFVSHEFSHDDLLKWADAAMYRAKDEGRNLACFHTEVTATAA